MLDRTKPIVNICTLGHADYGRTLTAAITKVLAPQGGATLVAAEQIGTEPILYNTGKRSYVHSVPPGNNSDFTVALYQNLTWADSAILVVAAQEGVSTSLRLQLKIAQKYQIGTHDWKGPKLVVFLDTDGMNYDRGKLDALKSEVRSALEDVDFDFISGSSRAALAAIDSQAPECRPIVDLLARMDTTLRTPTRLIDTPFFMPIADTMLDPTGKSVVVAGCIERGRIHVGDQVSLVGYSPQSKSSIVTQVDLLGNKLDVASAGDFVHLVLRGLTLADVRRGQALGGRVISMFNCEIELINPQEGYLMLPIRDLEPQESMLPAVDADADADTDADTEIEVQTEEAETEEDLQTQLTLFDYDEIQILTRAATETAQLNLPEDVNMLLGGERATVRIELKHPTPLDKGTPIVLVSKGRLVGAGNVTEIVRE